MPFISLITSSGSLSKFLRFILFENVSFCNSLAISAPMFAVTPAAFLISSIVLNVIGLPLFSFNALDK